MEASGVAALKTAWRVLKKLKAELPHEPAIPLPGISLEKTTIQTYTGAPVFAAALLTIGKPQKRPKCPLTDEWIKKRWYS